MDSAAVANQATEREMGATSPANAASQSCQARATQRKSIEHHAATCIQHMELEPCPAVRLS